MSKSEPTYYVLFLGNPMPLNGNIYEKNEIAIDPSWGMIDMAKEAKDGIVRGMAGNALYRVMDEKEAKALDADKKSPCRISSKGRLTHFGTPDLMNPGAGRYPSASIYSDQGAKEAKLDKTPVHPRDANAKKDAKAKVAREKEAKAKAEAEAKEKEKAKKAADKEKPKKATKKKTGKGRK
jgi:hypothetical protein